MKWRIALEVLRVVLAALLAGTGASLAQPDADELAPAVAEVLKLSGSL